MVHCDNPFPLSSSLPPSSLPPSLLLPPPPPPPSFLHIFSPGSRGVADEVLGESSVEGEPDPVGAVLLQRDGALKGTVAHGQGDVVGGGLLDDLGGLVSAQACHHLSVYLTEGRGGKEGGKEGRREGGREGGKEGGREGGRDGGRKGGKERVEVHVRMCLLRFLYPSNTHTHTHTHTHAHTQTHTHTRSRTVSIWSPKRSPPSAAGDPPAT